MFKFGSALLFLAAILFSVSFLVLEQTDVDNRSSVYSILLIIGTLGAYIMSLLGFFACTIPDKNFACLFINIS